MTRLGRSLKQLAGSHKSWLLAALPLSLLALCVLTFPFADTLVSKTLSTSQLSSRQKSNIELAAAAIDGVVIKPGEEFSFNKVVGPRSERRGYRAAPSYLGPENPSTIGGGICLVSSAIYQAALEGNLTIEQRTAHLRTIKTVPAGLDATVWYGQADLKIRNTLSVPIQFSTACSNQTLRVNILARKPASFQTAKIERIVSRNAPGVLVVECLRRQGNIETLVSRDNYSISQ